jgi:deoxyribodipyrimidine photo-lyase
MIAIWWLRRDLRLADNPALHAALEQGHALLPLYVHAPHEESPWQPGAASRAWLHRSLTALSRDLEVRGSRLLVRRGDSEGALRQLLQESGAQAVFCNRLYEPVAQARDLRVLAAMRADSVHTGEFDGGLLLPPQFPRTLAGGTYRVFGAWWRAAAPLIGEPRPLPAPTALPPVPQALRSEPIESLGLQPQPGWDGKFWRSGWQPGEAGAQEMLEAFVEGAAHGYEQQRELPDRVGSSRLSPHLHFGEVSPRQALAAVRAGKSPRVPAADQARFAIELGWRDFAVQTLLANPDYGERNLDRGFDGFRWATPQADKLRAWQRGQTGVPLVDAGMRELWQTGWMHNRVRMVVASFLTKNLRYHWSHGARWFWDTLLDADLANNSQGWQWTAGTGADAAPYFRVFNPARQGERFDPRGDYVRRWVPEVAKLPDKALHAPWEHQALTRQLAPDYPAAPIVDLAKSRLEALQAFRLRREGPAVARNLRSRGNEGVG